MYLSVRHTKLLLTGSKTDLLKFSQLISFYGTTTLLILFMVSYNENLTPREKIGVEV